MRPNDDIEKRLQSAPLPRLQDGPHRDTLKQSLFAEMNKETVMNDKATTPAPATPIAPPPRRLRPRWVAALAGVAALAIVAIGVSSVMRTSSEAPAVAKSDVVSAKITNLNKALDADLIDDLELPSPNINREFQGSKRLSVPGEVSPDAAIGNLNGGIVPLSLDIPPPAGLGSVGQGGALAKGMPMEKDGEPRMDKDGMPSPNKDGMMMAKDGTPKGGGGQSPPSPPVAVRYPEGLPGSNPRNDAKIESRVRPIDSIITQQHSIELGSPQKHGDLTGRLELERLLPPDPPKVVTFGGGLAKLKAPDAAPMPEKKKDPNGPIQGLAPNLELNTGDRYVPLVENPFHKSTTAPLSTFSVDVDTASYTNVRRFITQERQLPPPDAVRIEELVNYFTYDDPRPKDEKPVAIKAEVGPCPWNAEHKLVRIGLRAKSVSAEDAPPRNLVFLVDTSGSMSPADRLPLFKKGLSMLVGTLRPQDQVAIVEYAGRAGLVLPTTPGSQKEKVLGALDKLYAEGSTNGGEGIVLAYKIAQDSFIKGGVNRVILGTDGDFNVGVTSESDLVKMIEENRKSGILLSILGFGHGNLKDATMEKLAHHGNGHYAYVDTLEECHRIFVEQGAALQVVAYDVKVQVEFNPAKVASYRLVGYENRLMKHEDFNNDKKDAGDMGSGHTVTALYEIVPAEKAVAAPGVAGDGVDPLRYQQQQKPEPAPNLTDAAKTGELMQVKVRYKDPGEEKSKLITQPVTDVHRPIGETSNDFRFASAVAEFALCLRDSKYKGAADLANVVDRARGSVGLDAHGHRAAFVQLVQAAQQIKR